MADNNLWALDREARKGRILLFAHNGHVMNARTRGVIWAVYTKPPAAMGFHLRRALGRDLLIIGGSSPTRGEGAGGPGETDAALARVGREHFLVDNRSETGDPAQWLSREKHLSANYTTENLVFPRQALDRLIFFDRLTRSQVGR